MRSFARHLFMLPLFCFYATAHGEGVIVFGRWPNGSPFCLYNLNFSSKYEAVEAAMSACRAQAFNCRVDTTFHNSCIALAVNARGGCYYQTHPERHEAHNGALRRCAQGRIDCWIHGSGCDNVDELEATRREEARRQAEEMREREQARVHEQDLLTRQEPVTPSPSIDTSRREIDDEPVTRLLARGEVRSAWKRLGAGQAVVMLALTVLAMGLFYKARATSPSIATNLDVETLPKWKRVILTLGCISWCLVLATGAYVRINKQQILASQAGLKQPPPPIRAIRPNSTGR